MRVLQVFTRSQDKPAALPLAETIFMGLVVFTFATSACWRSVGANLEERCGSNDACPAGTRCAADGTCRCDSESCSGCCSADGLECLGGLDNAACGQNGESCAACPPRTSCVDGDCIPEDPCDGDCDVEEARQCDGTGTIIEVCRPDARGCLTWTQLRDCTPDTCENGSCEVFCPEDCGEVGEIQCVNDVDGGGAYQICQDLDGNGCTEWSDTIECDEGSCPSDTCPPPECFNECTEPGQLACDLATPDEQDRLVCGFWTDEHCLSWGPQADCPNERPICVGAGECKCVDQCTRDTRSCIGNDVYLCTAETDADCTAWQLLDECGERQICHEGECHCADECDDLLDGHCNLENEFELCLHDDDGCAYLEFEEFCEEACDPNEGCIDFCADACTEAQDNMRRCRPPNVIERCMRGEDEGCRAWFLDEECPPGQGCAFGYCYPPCSDDGCDFNEQTDCFDEESIHVCYYTEVEGCFRWAAPERCDLGLCIDGRCL